MDFAAAAAHAAICRAGMVAGDEMAGAMPILLHEAGGRCCVQISVATGQRGRKGAADDGFAQRVAPGRRFRSANLAASAMSRARRPAWARPPAARLGVGVQRPFAEDGRRTVPSSTLRPAYITTTRSAISATTPRVVGDQHDGLSRGGCCRSRIRSRICAGW